MDPAAEDFWRRHPIREPLQRLRDEADKVAKLIAHNDQKLGAYRVIPSSYRNLVLTDEGRKLVLDELAANEKTFKEAVAKNMLIRIGKGERGLPAFVYWMYLAQKCRFFLRLFAVDGAIDHRVCRELWAHRRAIEPIIEDPTNLRLLEHDRQRSLRNDSLILAVSWSARLFFFREIASVRSFALVAGYSSSGDEHQPPPASNGSREIVQFLSNPEQYVPARVLEAEDVDTSLQALLRVAQHYGTVLGFEKDENPEIRLRVASDSSSTANAPPDHPRRSPSTLSADPTPPQVDPSASSAQSSRATIHSQGGGEPESRPRESFRARARSTFARVFRSTSRN